jgi:hypothetical protein
MSGHGPFGAWVAFGTMIAMGSRTACIPAALGASMIDNP